MKGIMGSMKKGNRKKSQSFRNHRSKIGAMGTEDISMSKVDLKHELRNSKHNAIAPDLQH